MTRFKVNFEWWPIALGGYNVVMSTFEIRDLALKLPPEDRALIARDLLASLHEGEPAADVEAAWIEEIEARAEAYEAGLAPAEDWEVSLARARQEFREGRKPWCCEYWRPLGVNWFRLRTGTKTSNPVSVTSSFAITSRRLRGWFRLPRHAAGLRQAAVAGI